MYLFILFNLISFFYASNIKNFDLITTNDIHGAITEQYANFMNPNYPPKIIGGSGYYKYIKDNTNNSNSLIVDGGNFYQGHPLSEIDSGKTIIEFMNKVGYDALVPGPDDFIYGAKNLNKLANLSNFPFLIANLKCNSCDLISNNFKPYTIKEINGVKFGLLGIVDFDLKNKIPNNKIKGISPVGIKESLQYWTPILDSLSDITIVLTSTGVPYDREKVYNDFIFNLNGYNHNVGEKHENLNAIQMGYFAKGIDIIVSGGVSKGYDLPWVDPNNGVIILQNYGNGTSFGHIKLNVADEMYFFSDIGIRKVSTFLDGFDFVVKNKLSQTLLADDFLPDLIMKEWINNRDRVAIENLYSTLNIERNSFTNHTVETNYNFTLSDNWQFPKLGTFEKFDILTWNCEFFPTANEHTIDALSEAIYDLDVDIIAFQEIKQAGWFDRLMKLLPNYKYVISEHSSFMNQAIIYKNIEFELIRKIEPFAENDYNFAGRPPLRADFYRFSDSSYYSIVDLHMKCCDSGLERRKNASKMLHKYLANEIELGYSNFIVLGDWNDDLKDNYNEHCFNPFIEDNRFTFVTTEISKDISQATYPSEPYVSFLDNILVTNSLLSKFSNYDVKTINIGDYMNGFENYERLISDHFPVFLSF